MTEQLREKIDREIEYLAYEQVVPITGNPTTPYEFGAIKQYKAILGLLANYILSLPEIKEALGKEPVKEPCPDNSLVQCNSYDIDCKRCIHCKPHKETADCKDYVRCETTGLEVRCETCNGTGSK